MDFRIVGLPAENFAHLFTLSDSDLAAAGGVRRKADYPYPCRVSLTDAEPGEELVLINYEHHAVDSPYRMRFAIFVRQGDETYDKVNEVPEQLRKRTLAVRSFDDNGMMVANRLVDGKELEPAIEELSRLTGPPICTSISPQRAAMRPRWRGRKICGVDNCRT